MGINTNQIATVDNLKNNLYYRVDTSNSKYSTSSKCVTESMLTGLSEPSTTTATGRAKHTKVNTTPLRILQTAIINNYANTFNVSKSPTTR